MSIHEGQRARLKQRFAEHGERVFDDHQLLELMLFYAVPQGDVNPLAHRLINHFGSFAAVLDAKPEELRKVKGVGDHTALFLSMFPQVLRRYLASKSDSEEQITSATDAGEFLLPYFFGARNEKSFLACFDSKGKLLGVRPLSEGTPNANEISLRKITTEALALNATVVVLAHNHPSGLATPSQEDLFLTRYIQDSLKPLGITLYDHVILTDDDMVSLRDSRYLTPL